MSEFLWVFARMRLIVAGGYDSRLRQSRETLAGLQSMTQRLGLEGKVTLMRSPSDVECVALLFRCFCVVYTPEDEHFGYVPLEAMRAGRPVIAVNSGGVREAVRHGETGLLCAATPDVFAGALSALLADTETAARMGRAGQLHVAAHFSRAAFAARLEGLVGSLVAGE